MVLQIFFLVSSDLCGGKKQLFYFLERWLFWALGKNECAVCALAFLVQMFNFSTISALCTTVLYKNSRAEKKRLLFGWNTSRIFKFFLLSFLFNKPNLKIWRPCKSAFTIGLNTYCPIIFIRCVCSAWAEMVIRIKGR